MSYAEDEDEEAFHSADEGDEPSGNKITSKSSKKCSPTGPSVIQEPQKPHKEPVVTETAQQPASSAKVDTSFGDGWSMDTWDLDDDDEVMVTPAADRPPRSFAEAAKVTESHSNEEEVDYFEDLAKKRQQVLEKLTTGFDDGSKLDKPASLWGGWNSWLTVASDSLNNLTSSVGEGFTSVLETMESSIGAPTPEELARLSIEERCELRKKADDVKEPLPSDEKDDCDSAEEAVSEGGSDTNTARSDKDDLSSGYQSDNTVNAQQKRLDQQGFTGLFTNVSHLLETTSRSLVTGSLDVMETIGKKTFHVLTEPADPATQRRRLKFKTDKPNLSSVLKELKHKADEADLRKEQELEARRWNYSVLFEEYQGMINLEGLEMLSEGRYMQMQTLLKSVDAENLPELDSALNELKINFDVVDDKSLDFAADNNETFENFDANLKKELKLSKLTTYTPSRLMEIRRKHFCWVEICLKDQQKGERYEAKVIYEHAIQCLAEITAAGVEMFHKIGQLLLAENINPKAHHLANVTKFLVQEIGVLSTKFSSALNTAADDSEDPDSVNPMLTNLFLEANNSSSYIRDASQLLLPVLQVLCIKNSNFV